MPHQTEPNANNALGSLLRNMLSTCVVRSENTQTFADHPGRHADALITSPGRSPMVDMEAAARLSGRRQPQPRSDGSGRRLRPAGVR